MAKSKRRNGHSDAATDPANTPVDPVKALLAAAASHRLPETPRAPPREMPPVPERSPAPPGYTPPDFPALYAAIGLTSQEQAHIGRASELLQTFPGMVDDPLQRQIVERTLRAFDVPPEQVSAAMTRAAQALDGWIALGDSELRRQIEATALRIQELRAEELRLARELSDRQAAQRSTVLDVRTQQTRLRQAAAFFSRKPDA